MTLEASRKIFVDSGVLIAAIRGGPDEAAGAFAILDDPGASFASSAFVQLEVLPKALFHRRSAEAEFYQRFFEAVEHWALPGGPLVDDAMSIAMDSGLSAMDGLHAAAARQVGAGELVTSERPDKPIFRVRDLTVRSIRS